jgi:hypothetical protein
VADLRAIDRDREAEDHLLLAGIMDDDGVALDDVQCRRIFDLAGTSGPRCEIPDGVATELADSRSRLRQSLLDGLGMRNGRWFDGEMDLNKQDGGNRKFILVQLPEPSRRDRPSSR